MFLGKCSSFHANAKAHVGDTQRKRENVTGASEKCQVSSSYVITWKNFQRMTENISLCHFCMFVTLGRRERRSSKEKKRRQSTCIYKAEKCDDYTYMYLPCMRVHDKTIKWTLESHRNDNELSASCPENVTWHILAFATTFFVIEFQLETC